MDLCDIHFGETVAWFERNLEIIYFEFKVHSPVLHKQNSDSYTIIPQGQWNVRLTCCQGRDHLLLSEK